MKSWRRETSMLNGWRDCPYQISSYPMQVQKWLSSLALLEEVPLSYLIPDQRQIPPESIRFFTIDPQWIRAMLDGATGVGIYTRDDAEQNTRHSNLLMQDVESVVIRTLRQEKMHPNHRRPIVETAYEDSSILSGFLLRSDLVSHWKGVEVKGFSENLELKTLRMETLSEKLLLCIFEGYIDEIRIYEPKEALHFGTKDSKRTIEVRRIDEGYEGEPLYRSGGKEKETVDIPVQDNGRVQFIELAQRLEKVLSAPGAVRSPQMALEMLSVAGQCVFKREESK